MPSRAACSAPSRGGSSPRPTPTPSSRASPSSSKGRAAEMRARLPLLIMLAGAGGAGGCGVNNPTYFTPPMGAVETGQGDGGAEIASVVVLPFRNPTDGERAKLSEESDALGFQEPW